MVEVEAPAQSEPVTYRRALAAPVPLGRVLTLFTVLVLAAGAALYLVTRPTPAATYRVEVGISAFPANVNAIWQDTRGGTHSLDVWTGKAINLQATRVVVAVSSADNDPVQCTININGNVTDTATTSTNTSVAICFWSAS